jgi:catechol 2,3-dioxygenase
MTRFPVCALRSAELDTPDLALSEAFYTKVWGLTVAARTDAAVYLRATGDDHHVLALHAAARSALRAVVFRTETAADLAAIAQLAQAQGRAMLDPPADPAGGIGLAFRDPNGLALRFVHRDQRHADAVPLANRPLRLAHVNVNSTDVDATAMFFQSVLGFQLTDRSKLMAFVRCNPDHHAVVIAEAKVSGLNHIAFLMPDLESVMRGSGRLVDHGHAIGWGVGRHGPGDNVFAYFLDPLGVVVEYTAEVLQVDDSYRFRGPDEWVWPPGRTDHWGIAPPKSEHVKQAQLAIPFA